MMRITSRPAILPASLVACRCASLKYAGTVITACVTFSPRYASAASFSLARIIAEISGGEYFLPLISTRASFDVAAHHLVGDHLHLFGDFVVAPPHEALDRKNRVLGVGDGLPLGDLADQPLPALGERHDGRRGAVAFLVGNDGRLPAFHDGHHGVRGSQVDADNLAHVSEILLDAY